MGQKDVISQIKEVDVQLLERKNARQELANQQREELEKEKELLSVRCGLLSGVIFKDTHKFILDCLSLKKRYGLLMDRVSEYGEHRPTLYEYSKEQKKEAFWLTVSDAFLKPRKLQERSLGTFINDLCSLNEGLKNTPYPDLRRD